MFDFFGELKKLKKLEKFFAKLILFSGAQGSKGKRQMFWSTILLASLLLYFFITLLLYFFFVVKETGDKEIRQMC